LNISVIFGRTGAVNLLKEPGWSPLFSHINQI